jgi:hypothetical protein
MKTALQWMFKRGNAFRVVVASAIVVCTASVTSAQWTNVPGQPGWQSYYSAGEGTSYYRIQGQVVNHFAFNWTYNQWWQYDSRGSWNQLSGKGCSSSPIFDGKLHALNNSWNYYYLGSNDAGIWNLNGYDRFGYLYKPGQWSDYDARGGWKSLGNPSRPSNFIGDGAWHIFGMGNWGWNFIYLSSSNVAVWNLSGRDRFGYSYGPGQWADYDAWGGWKNLGMSGLASSFIGDGAWHSTIGQGQWDFLYAAPENTAYWNRSGYNASFAYGYNNGQWWDKTTSNGWGRLGVLAGMGSQFIGDNTWHQFTGGDLFAYDPNDNSYYWNNRGVLWYSYNFAGAGTWYYHSSPNGSWNSLTYNGTWQNPDVRYLYTGLFVERGLTSDTSGSYAPTGKKKLEYDVWDLNAGNWSRKLASWTIYNPGADNKWSGGDLNVLWGNTRHTENGNTYFDDFNQYFREFTLEDVVCFSADFEQNPIGFKKMVDWTQFVSDYFGKGIRTVQVCAHGNPSGWEMGEWMSSSNYTHFEQDWRRFGRYMTSDGQIISIHCESGQAAGMLNQIAAWSGCDIFANTNITNTRSSSFNASYVNPEGGQQYGGSTYWNGNMKRMVWTDANTGTFTPNRNFEYRSNPWVSYRYLLSDTLSY